MFLLQKYMLLLHEKRNAADDDDDVIPHVLRILFSLSFYCTLV